jgi:peptidoglycan/LPS O-acetylase OafA/YrhL
VAIGIFGAAIAAGVWHIPGTVPQDQTALVQREWVVSVALAGLTLAIGLAARNLRVPAVLAWLGLVSYSVYLLHPLVLDVYDSVPFAPGYNQAAWLQAVAGAVFLAVLLACCAGTYYLVEAPMQRLGRRLAARLDARFRPDCPEAAGAPAS